jgi:Kef-type K+ transport system membrane component KefB
VSPITPAPFLIVAGAILIAWAAGRLAHRLGHPPVVGELAAGLALGPSVFGLAAPALFQRGFTADVTGVLGTISTSAILVFMLLAALSITAMPVLTRILVDLHMLRTTTGTIAMGCATIHDVVAWMLLGIVVGLVRGETVVVSTILMTAAYLGVMFVVIRPLLRAVAGLRSLPWGRVLWAAASPFFRRRCSRCWSS